MAEDQAQSKEERKDFFISYARADKQWAEWIAWQLEQEDYRITLQAWDFRPGGNLVLLIDEAIKEAERVIAVLSPDYFTASDTAAQWSAAFRGGALLPIQIRECGPSLSGVLGTIIPIDLLGLDETAAREHLLTGIRRERARPVTPPAFPRTILERPAFPGALPTIWNIPYQRNPFFTGRENILTTLTDVLSTGQPMALSQPQAISGLGGIGKTQIAVEYAYRSHQNYQAVFWSRADSRDALISGYVTLADLLKLPEKDEQEQIRTINAVKHWLREHDRWLLILDNVDDLTLLKEFVPSAGGGHILLTTRTQAPGKLARSLEVDVLETDLGALFLLRRASILEHDALLESATTAQVTIAREITQELGGLPLALDQAGAYIEEAAYSLSEYLALYRTQRTALLKRRSRDMNDDHPESVATTWSLSFERVQHANPAAAELLRLCAFLAADAIPEEMLMQGAHLLGPVLGPTVSDQLTFNDAIIELRKYSLMRRETASKTLSVHRLVQAVLKDQMKEQDRHQWSERAVQAVNAAFPTVEHQTWPQCDRLLPHALLCATWIEQKSMAFPEAAHLLNQMGDYLEKRAQYKEAESLLEQALAIRAQIGTESLDIAQSLNNLAHLYQTQGKHEQVEPLYQRALSIYEQELGADHSWAATSLNNLAALYRDQGKYEQAEPLYQRALSICEQQLGPDHPNTALSLNNLAALYQDQGKYEQTEPLYVRALAICEQQLGPQHPDTAGSLNNLAALYYNQRKYQQAEPLFKRALAIREQQLGPQHPHTANSLNNLALLYRDQGKDEQAEPLFKRALAISEQQLGPQHPDTAGSLNNLAELYQDQGQYEQAEPLLQRALAIDERALGPQHPTTQTIRANSARLLRTMGHDAEAAALDQS